MLSGSINKVPMQDWDEFFVSVCLFDTLSGKKSSEIISKEGWVPSNANNVQDMLYVRGFQTFWDPPHMAT